MTPKVHIPAQTNPMPRPYSAPSTRARSDHPLSAANLWRRWWLRAAKAKQMRHLHLVALDPHMAKDLGLPVTERPLHKFNSW